MNDYFGRLKVGSGDLFFNPEDNVVTCPVGIVAEIVIEAQMGNSLPESPLLRNLLGERLYDNGMVALALCVFKTDVVFSPLHAALRKICLTDNPLRDRPELLVVA